MFRITTHMPTLYRRGLYLAFAASWFSGLGFFILDTFFQIETEFGLQKHGWQNPALTLHGAAAFIMMMWFGSLLAAHMPFGWRATKGKNAGLRNWGIALVGAVGLQVFTAYCLYYMAWEIPREVIKWVHLIIGVTLPLLVIGHVVTGRKLK